MLINNSTIDNIMIKIKMKVILTHILGMDSLHLEIVCGFGPFLFGVTPFLYICVYSTCKSVFGLFLMCKLTKPCYAKKTELFYDGSNYTHTILYYSTV